MESLQTVILDMAKYPPEDWPWAVKRWLEHGHESDALWEYADLSEAEARRDPSKMAAVLQSLGVEVSDTTPFEAQIFELSGFAGRCRTALGVIATDLNRGRREKFSLNPVQVGATFSEYTTPIYAQAALSDGSSVGTGDVLMAWMDDAELLANAANSVCAVLLLVMGLRWPRCLIHAHSYLIPGEMTGGSPVMWWWCNNREEHAVSPIGELTSAHNQRAIASPGINHQRRQHNYRYRADRVAADAGSAINDTGARSGPALGITVAVRAAQQRDQSQASVHR